MTTNKQHKPASDELLVMGALIRACAAGVSTRALIAAIDRTHNGWTRLVASHDGDGSVGLPGDVAYVELDLSGYDAGDRADMLAHAREALAEAFSGLWDARAKVREG